MPAERHHFKGITIKTKEGCLLLVTAKLRGILLDLSTVERSRRSIWRVVRTGKSSSESNDPWGSRCKEFAVPGRDPIISAGRGDY
jgi:hypothetical protein